MSRRTSRRAASALRDPHEEAERIAYRERIDAFVASRDVAAGITRTTLADGVTAEALIVTAAAVAQFVDEALADVAEVYRPAIACGKGCSYCCRKPGVLVTIPEVLRILARVSETFDAAQLEALRARAARYRDRLQGRRFNDPISDSIPCPLLVDDQCTAYDVRPLVCRGFNSASADACRTAHGSAEQMIPMFAILKDVADGATVGLAQASKQARLDDAVVDLGTALHVALRGVGDLAGAVVRGERPLAEAHDDTWVADLWSRVREVAREVGAPI